MCGIRVSVATEALAVLSSITTKAASLGSQWDRNGIAMSRDKF